MRKVLLSLLVLALAAPSFAAVNITAEDAGSGVLKLYYECTAGEVIRGLALAVEVTAGDGVVAAETDAVVPKGSRFNTFIDYAFTVEAGAPGTYAIGAGHPLANKVAAGVATFPATVYSVSMGCLDEFEKVQGGVTGSGELVAIKYTLTADTTVAISADTLRGGIVGDGITEVNIQASQVVVGGECIPSTNASYAQWVTVGKPLSWCNKRQCKGDANEAQELIGKNQRWVGYADINILLDGFNKAYTGAEAWIAADFDRNQELIGKNQRRVGYNDINILLQYFNTATVPDTCND
jgi:hypothetical protein